MRDKPYVEFGLELRKIREKWNLTLQQVVDEIGMNSTQNLSAVENGTTLLEELYHKKFCKLFGLNVEEFGAKIDKLRKERRLFLQKEKIHRKKLGMVK